MAKTILLALFLISAIALTVSAAGVSIPIVPTYDVKVTGNGQYTFHTDHVSWGEARRRCHNQDSQLAEIMSETELKALQEELHLIRAYDSAWVGGRGAQPGEVKHCDFFWNERGDKISIRVEELNGSCNDGSDYNSDRQFLRVEVVASTGLKARHGSSILPYICKVNA